MLFKDIAGNVTTKSYLTKLVDDGRLPHALMLVGGEGCGKMAMALTLAQYAQCTNRSNGEPCNQCPSCIKIRKLEHPDLHFVFPVVTLSSNSKPTSDTYIKEWKNLLLKSPYISLNMWMSQLDAENKQPQIYAHESANILKKLSLKSYESEFKVMIIYLPERMNIQCANKLLKLIEEPPEKTVFIFVSEAVEQLLPTIVSRCQIINIPHLSDEVVKTYLEANYEDRIQHIPQVVRIANGNLVKAMDLINQSEDNAQYLKLFIGIMRASYKRDVVAMRDWTDSLIKVGRERQKTFLQFTQRMFRESFVYNFKQLDTLNYLSPEELQFCTKFAAFVNERNIMQLMDLYQEAEYHIERNVQARMVFFDIALRTTVLLKS